MISTPAEFSSLFQALLVSLLLTLVTGLIGIWIARRFNLMDFPGVAPYKQHKMPMPYAGGIALVLSLIVLTLLTGLWRDPEIRSMMIIGLVVFGFGLLDDIRRLSPQTKILGQLFAAILVVFSGVTIQVFESQSFFFGGSSPLFVWLDRFLTVFWIVGVTNAFNLVDSMDGLSVGLSGWAFAFFMLATITSGQHLLSVTSAIMVGICLAIFYYNSSPAKLFLGDSGAQTLGFLLSVMAILYNPIDSFQTSSYLVPILLVGVPIFDTSLVTISRLRKRIPFYKGNRDHTYHRLVVMGMEPSRAVFTMHLGALVLDCLAFTAVSLPPFWANGVLALTILAGVILVLFFEKRQA
jgi:UDP-GlcNAc:undecaprenyl-phosphate/decaprenyl-phosphate GlcNAc-1-phosphate transferase